MRRLRKPTSCKPILTQQYPERPTHTWPMRTLQTLASDARPWLSARCCISNICSLNGTKYDTKWVKGEGCGWASKGNRYARGSPVVFLTAPKMTSEKIQEERLPV